MPGGAEPGRNQCWTIVIEFCPTARVVGELVPAQAEPPAVLDPLAVKVKVCWGTTGMSWNSVVPSAPVFAAVTPDGTTVTLAPGDAAPPCVTVTRTMAALYGSVIAELIAFEELVRPRDIVMALNTPAVRGVAVIE